VRALGFMGKSAIHPRQIPILHDVFTPSPDEVERARRVIAVAEEGQAIGVVDGGFVDRPVVSQARAVLEMARRFESRGG
jgi:citrate lyase beta subunit